MSQSPDARDDDGEMTPKAVIHSADTFVKTEHKIGYEFLLMTKEAEDQQAAAAGSMSKVPDYMEVDAQMLGEHVYCFEFKETMQTYYKNNDVPRIIMLRSWETEMGKQFARQIKTVSSAPPVRSVRTSSGGARVQRDRRQNRSRASQSSSLSTNTRRTRNRRRRGGC